MPKVGKDLELTQKNIAFCKWLRGKVKSENLKFQDLAKNLGVSRQALNYHMKEHRPFSYTQLVLIFEFTKADPEEIQKLLTRKTNK